MSALVHVLCPVYNGAPFLGAFLESIRAQSHRNWVLWLRDDGSTDDSVSTINQVAAEDDRIRLAASGDGRLGALGAFRWLWDRTPADAAYLMFADQDDIWLPEKIHHALGVMRSAERERPAPLLVHTDLVVVDEALRPLAHSFWEYSKLIPASASLRRMAVHNVVTGNTVLLNRALRERIGSIPPEAAMHDWWVACVAAAFGRVIASPHACVWYRQHGANVIGARAHPGTLTDVASWRRAIGAPRRVGRVRADMAAAARQAGALAERYGKELDAADLRFLQEYAALPARGFLHRKLGVCRLHLLPEHGVLRNVGVLLRA